MNAHQEITHAQVVEIMRGERFVMLSTATPDGKIVAHPMTPQQITDEAAAWFFIPLDSDQASAIRNNPQVNLAFAETGTWLSVAGQAEFVDDAAKVEELWDDQVASYYEGGKADPNLGLLKVSGDSAQYWGIPGSKVTAVVNILASKIRGTDGPGVSATTDL